MHAIEPGRRMWSLIRFALVPIVYILFARVAYVVSLPGPWPARGSALLFEPLDVVLHVLQQAPVTIGLLSLFCGAQLWRSPTTSAKRLWTGFRERRTRLPLAASCAAMLFLCFLTPYYIWLILLYFLLLWATALVFIAPATSIFSVLGMVALLGMSSIAFYAGRSPMDFECRPEAMLVLLSGEMIPCTTIYPLEQNLLVETGATARVLGIDDVTEVSLNQAIGPATAIFRPPTAAP